MARALDLSVWYEALASSIGVVLQVEDVEVAKQRLYSFRDRASDPDLYSISIITSPTAPTRELWLIKRSAQDEAT